MKKYRVVYYTFKIKGDRREVESIGHFDTSGDTVVYYNHTFDPEQKYAFEKETIEYLKNEYINCGNFVLLRGYDCVADGFYTYNLITNIIEIE